MPILNTASGPCYQDAMNWRAACAETLICEDGVTQVTSKGSKEMSFEEQLRFYFRMNEFPERLLYAFAQRVNEKAMDLMLLDGKVEGKHYAAMKLVLNEVGIEHNLK